MNLREVKQKVKNALNNLYNEDPSLIEKGLCERCISFRFTVYLEKEGFGNDYFVDSEYNKTHTGDTKKVNSLNGNYIDIIISKRTGRGEEDLVCFELKKWSNTARKKDRENLEYLTGRKITKNGDWFSYNYGFYVIFGETKEKTKIEIYQKDQEIEKIKYLEL